MIMRRSFRSLAIVAALVLLAPLDRAVADHAGNTLASPVGIPVSAFALETGDWEFITNYPLGPAALGPLGVDASFVRRGNRVYAVVSSTTLGLRIFDITDPDTPVWVADYGSATLCPTAGGEGFVAKGGDALALPSGWENDSVVNQADLDGVIGHGKVRGDGTLAVIGTDAGGRCHDPSYGGMELVDISDPAHPALLWLTRQTGENHNTSFDPFHNVLYVNNSDIGENNFIDILDLNGCKTRAQGGNGRCRVEEARYQFPPGLAAARDGGGDSGCHDITVRKNRIYCAAVNATIVFDTSRLRTKSGRLSGDRLPCGTTTGHPVYAAGAPIVSDCRISQGEFAARRLRSARLTPVAVAHHGGIGTEEPPDQDISISHDADPIRRQPILAITDERAGALTNADGCPGGAVWFYDIRGESLRKAKRDGGGVPIMKPMILADAHGRIVRDETGRAKPAAFLTQHYLPGTTLSCTAHIIEQWGSEPRMFVAWYL
ncbi:MAG: hypothetical protein ABR518_06940, partial [Actinomycetota bacterium]